MVLPAHAQTSQVCMSCLSVATYCDSGASDATKVSVAADGIITLVTSSGSATGQIDECLGGTFSVTIGASTISGAIPCGEVASIAVTVDDGSSTTSLTLSKDLCSVIPPVTCLLAATYCEGSGMGSTQVTVTTAGNVTVIHPNGTANATIDSSTGGNYSVTVMSMGGNTITLSGSIPCGDVDSVELIEDNGTGTTTLTLRKDLC
ncbi:MAG: hypothetical protein ACJAQ6_000657 [Arenicella sp.]|jgi:hypothetical protein